ncbi:MAG: TonB-dependent receptor plug domain-containing protein, partial [Steroidobacter sp.]
RYGHRTLADVLRSVRGLYVSNDRNYTYLGVRGFLRPNDYNTRVLVLIDGHRVNDNLFDSGTIEREGMIDVELIERVEVIRGPGSSIYGSSAFLGVINVITRSGAGIGGVEIAVETESFDTRKSRLTFGEKFDNGVEWLLSGSHYASEGPERLYYPEFDQRISDNPNATNDGVAYRLDDEDAWNVFTSVSQGEFTASAWYLERAKNVPTASFGTMFNEREWTKDYRAYVDVQYDHAFNDDVRLKGSGFVDEYRYRGMYPYNYAESGDPVDIVPLYDSTVGQWVGTEWQLSARLRDRHTVLAGVEYRNNLREFQESYEDLEPRVYTVYDDRTSRVLGVYAQGEFALRDDLLLTGGMRYDRYFNTFGGNVSPRAGLIYSPLATTTFKALYGQAFRAPNPYELYYNVEQRLRPTLAPEQIDAYELVYEQYLGQALRLSVSGYQYETEDLVSQHATDAGDPYFANLDHVRARGVEFELAAEFESGLVANASYTLQRAVDVASDQELTSSPRHLAKLNISAPFLNDKFVAGLELQYQSEVRTLADRKASDFLVANLNILSRPLWRGLEISAAVSNLFDTAYGYPGAEDHAQDVIAHDGRSFRGALTYKF